jgi:glucoamylase
MAFGAAPGPRSKLWYTLADGALSEVFFPFIDRVALHELRFFTSAGGAPPVDDSGDGQHRITWASPGVPAFIVDSTHHEYRLTKEFFSDPEENALLIAATFTPELPDVRLYMQASAHWQPGTEGNFANVLDTNPPALLLRQQDVWICIVGLLPDLGPADRPERRRRLSDHVLRPGRSGQRGRGRGDRDSCRIVSDRHRLRPFAGGRRRGGS